MVKPCSDRPGWTVEDISRNGVKVLIFRNKDGSYVQTDCKCHGLPNRVHSNPHCPNLKRIIREDSATT